MKWFRWDNDDLICTVRVQPRASRNEICGIENEALKLRITAAPAGGEANRCVAEFLADAFGVSKSSVELVRGHKARQKQLRIRAPRKIPTALADQIRART